MRKGEQALVTLQADGHDVSGMVPANSLLRYEVELLDFTKVFCYHQIFCSTKQGLSMICKLILSTRQEKPFWKMENHEKLEACERKKHDGNILFKAAKFGRASKKYEKEINFPAMSSNSLTRDRTF